MHPWRIVHPTLTRTTWLISHLSMIITQIYPRARKTICGLLIRSLWTSPNNFSSHVSDQSQSPTAGEICGYFLHYCAAQSLISCPFENCTTSSPFRHWTCSAECRRHLSFIILPRKTRVSCPWRFNFQLTLILFSCIFHL